MPQINSRSAGRVVRRALGTSLLLASSLGALACAGSQVQSVPPPDLPVSASSETAPVIPVIIRNRGTFDVTVKYPSGHAGIGSLIVFESSAKDGSQINVVEIPIRLR